MMSDAQCEFVCKVISLPNAELVTLFFSCVLVESNETIQPGRSDQQAWPFLDLNSESLPAELSGPHHR